MSGIEHIRKLISVAVISGPVSEDLIRSAEEQLGVRFPPSYRAFLGEFGAFFGAGCEIAGLFPPLDEGRQPQFEDIVARTLDFRRPPAPLPQEYLPISSDGGDFMFYLDTSRPDAAGECPVIVLGPGADGLVVANDFFEFVDRCVNGMLVF